MVYGIAIVAASSLKSMESKKVRVVTSCFLGMSKVNFEDISGVLRL